MGRHHILICGGATERIRSHLQSNHCPAVRYSLVPDSYELPEASLDPVPTLVVASGDLLGDPIFQNWRKRRLPCVPLIWVLGGGRKKVDGADGELSTMLPEDELSALPYLIDLACVRSSAPPVQGAGICSTNEVRPFPRPIVGQSEEIQKVIRSARKVLNVNSSVLILGESGTGKELVASMVHHESARLKKPFVKVNCAAIPETLLESELFGIERNIATNVDMRIGKFEQADGGTIFLDEIGDMSLLTQAKVLRILQEREFERVGGTESIRVNTRILAATNKDLQAEIKQGKFRADLYYRLNVINIRIPPLRRRRKDISDLAHYFIDLYCRENGLETKKASDDVIELLMRHDWPGNVRELENAIERAVVIGEGDSIGRDDLPAHILKALQVSVTPPEKPYSFNRRVTEFKRSILIDALDRCGWVQARAARELGISERSMWHLFKKHRLDQVSKNARKSSWELPRNSTKVS